jgi:hypothetical protein
VRTIVAAAQDVTKRVRIKEALAQREAPLAQAYAVLQEACAQVGRQSVPRRRGTGGAGASSPAGQ